MKDTSNGQITDLERDGVKLTKWQREWLNTHPHRPCINAYDLM